MELNNIYNIDFLKNSIPDKSIDLIIADPPYFEVKGEFDFVWPSFEAYLKDVELWAKECKRILVDNGSLFWYGDSKKIAYSQIIIDKYFDLVNSLVWEKAEKDGLFGSTGNEQLRSFPKSTERILFYTNETYNLTNCVLNIRDYIRKEISKSKGKILFKDINKALGTATNGGGVASACLSLKKSQPSMFTKGMYTKLQNWCKPYLRREYEDLRREYEDLRREYEDLRRPFNNFSKSTEVLKFRFKPSTHDHETVKPEKLTAALILTCSRENDIVLAPFSGSGTEVSMAAKYKRRFIGFEINEKYHKESLKRLKEHTSQKALF